MALFEGILTVSVNNHKMKTRAPNGDGINVSFCEVTGVDLANNGGFASTRQYIGQSKAINGKTISKRFNNSMCLTMIDGLRYPIPVGHHIIDFRGAIVLHDAPNVPSSYFGSFPSSGLGKWTAYSVSGSHSTEIYSDAEYSIKIAILPADPTQRYVVAGFFGEQGYDLRPISDALIAEMYRTRTRPGVLYIPKQNLYRGSVNPYYAASAYIAMMQACDDYGVSVTASTQNPTRAGQTPPINISHTITGTIGALNKAAKAFGESFNEATESFANLGEYLEAKTNSAPQLDQVVKLPEEELDEISVVRISGDVSFQYTFTDGSETITVRLPEHFVYVGEVGGIVIVARNSQLALLVDVADYKKQLDNHMLRVLEDQSRRLGALSQAYRLLLPASAENKS